MKLLILTQRIDKNDGYLGFFHGWVAEFAKQCDQVVVLALEVGPYDLPKNVKVYSLGKDAGASRWTYLFRLWKYSWKERKSYDAVFAHMSPPFVIAGYPLWTILGKKIGLWYTHKSVDFKLRVATVLVDAVFSATPESFRIKTKKVTFTGQSVPLDKYARPADLPLPKNKVFKIVSVGRITPIKTLGTLIEAAAILRDQNIAVDVDLIGEPVLPADIEYKKQLVDLIAQKNVGDRIHFVGNIPNKDLPPLYWKSDLSVNLCPTGGLDKVVLESMAACTPAIVSNQAFREYFGAYADDMTFAQADAADCAKKIATYMRRPDAAAVRDHLFDNVEKKSNLKNLIARILGILNA